MVNLICGVSNQVEIARPGFKVYQSVRKVGQTIPSEKQKFSVITETLE